ncbi:MAG: hypothetical protein BMS9Abin01_0610 [Gammaproteobacteria bacterium]|nr:MAG: hypothetical protein BMS9Abin01_0610 [Gammaproteobacteria bacterium]
MLPAGKRNERLVALVLVGGLALNYPLLYVFSDARLLFGIPVLYLYLFAVWAIFIALAALITERSPVGDQADEGPGSNPED